ncbi:unnamed protein product [Taenia asiatica]|uniref:DUF5734 domain-containing protein n=1 Tax=Taenia asiatica TaxID=60517 RepID=A0A0R3W7H7_TAEAS|nr:unnamed protein product [Taenia asiatica]
MSHSGFSSEFSRVGAEEGSRTKGMKRDKMARSTRKVFSLDAFDRHPRDLLLSEMGKALKSEKKNVITACGLNDTKATLITLQFETEEEFSKAFGILEKYAKPKSVEMGSMNQEKANEVKSEPKGQKEPELNKTGDVPYESRASKSVNDLNLTSSGLNDNAPSDSQSSSVQDSSSITVLTLTNGESSSSCTNRGLTLSPKKFTRKDGNPNPISSRIGNQRRLVPLSPTSKNISNPLPPVKIVRWPERISDQEKSHQSLSVTSESSSETISSLPRPLGPLTQRSEHRTIPVQSLNSRAQSSNSSDSSSSSSGYCETCCSSSNNSAIQFYKGVEFIIPQCSHQHFNPTIDNVWVCKEPVDRGKSKTTGYHQKSWLCFH